MNQITAAETRRLRDPNPVQLCRAALENAIATIDSGVIESIEGSLRALPELVQNARRHLNREELNRILAIGPLSEERLRLLTSLVCIAFGDERFGRVDRSVPSLSVRSMNWLEDSLIRVIDLVQFSAEEFRDKDGIGDVTFADIDNFMRSRGLNFGTTFTPEEHAQLISYEAFAKRRVDRPL